MSASKQILALNRFEGTDTSGFPPELAKRLAKRRATFGASSVLFYEQPIEMVRGEGVYLFDSNGNRYLDMYNNVPSVGHCHPHVASAIAAQVARLNINTRYLSRISESYAERLLSHVPAPLSNLVMTCTGSEANDLALRIASSVTGKHGFIVTRAAYHGNTEAVTAISPSSYKGAPHIPHVRLIPAPSAEGDVGGTFAANLATAIKELEATEYGFAAIIVDSIFSSDGIFADPPGFLQPALALTHQHGGLFIADEVQPGFGRTGGGLWGSTHSRQTSSPWANPWAMATPWAVSWCARSTSRVFAKPPAISTPLAAARWPRRRAMRCSMSSRTKNSSPTPPLPARF